MSAVSFSTVFQDITLGANVVRQLDPDHAAMLSEIDTLGRDTVDLVSDRMRELWESNFSEHQDLMSAFSSDGNSLHFLRNLQRGEKDATIKGGGLGERKIVHIQNKVKYFPDTHEGPKPSDLFGSVEPLVSTSKKWDIRKAAAEGNLSVVKYLFEREREQGVGREQLARQRKQREALWFAEKGGHKEVAEFLRIKIAESQGDQFPEYIRGLRPCGGSRKVILEDFKDRVIVRPFGSIRYREEGNCVTEPMHEARDECSTRCDGCIVS